MLHYVFIMFSSLYREKKKTLSKTSKIFSKKVLTYNATYGNIRHVKRKDVKTVSINTQKKISKISQKVLDKQKEI